MTTRITIVVVGLIAVLTALLAVFLFIRTQDATEKPVPVPPATADSSATAPPAPVKPAARAAVASKPSAPATGPGVIRGTVYTLDGAPATASVVVRELVSGSATPRAGIRKTVCDSAGTFAVENLPHASYAVSAQLIEAFAVERVRLQPNEDQIDLVLVLHPGNLLAGTVVNEAGDGIANAYLRPLLRNGEKMAAETVESLATMSDQTGAFTFTALEPVSWELYVVATGYAPQLTAPLAVDATDHVIALSPAPVLTGLVVDAADNAPLVGVRVAAQAKDLRVPPLTAKSDTDGAFRIELGEGRWVVDVNSGDLIVVGGPVEVEVEPEAEIPPVELRVGTGGTVRGRIADGESGEGIAVATLRARPSNKLLRIVDRTSADDGAFEFTGLAEGEYTISPFALSGYSRENEHQKNAVVSVSPGEVVENAEVFVYRAGHVSGVVVDANQQPVPGALIDVSKGGFSTQISADNTGRFTYAGLSKEETVVLRASKGGAASDAMELLVPVAGMSGVTLTLSIDASATLGGVVVNQRGAPVQVELFGRGAKSPLNRFLSVETAADGRFLVTNLAPDDYTIGARRGMQPNKEIGNVRLGPGQELLNQRFVYPAASGVIAGKVIDASGKPAAATLSFMRREGDGLYPAISVSSRHDGAFIAEDLEEGLYEISVGGGFLPPRETVQAQTGDRNVVITVPGATKLEGRVIDAATQQPVTTFEIAAGRFRMDALPGARDFRNVTDPQGRFALPMDPGSYRVFVRAPRYQLARAAAGVPSEGEETVVALQPGDVKVQGRVLDAGGNGIAGAAVIIGPLPHSASVAFSRAAARTADDGTYEITGLSEGEITLSAFHVTQGLGTVTANIGPKESGPVDIALTPPAVVEGIVTMDGEPVRAVVAVETESGQRLTLGSDAEGRYRITNVPPGPATVTAEAIDSGADASAPATKQIEAVSGETITVNLDLVGAPVAAP